jgi:hypothetical protein
MDDNETASARIDGAALLSLDSSRSGMETDQLREKFDTGLKKIGHEIKSHLVLHGFYGTVSHSGMSEVPDGARVEIQVKGKTVGRWFDRQQIEGCCLRVGGAVLAGIIAMVDELAAGSESAATRD